MNREKFDEISRKSRVLRDFPCIAEKKLVDACYTRTGYDIDACRISITNYKTCKDFWASVEKQRRIAGVHPAKPNEEEREKIKAYFRQHKKLPKFPMDLPS